MTQFNNFKRTSDKAFARGLQQQRAPFSTVLQKRKVIPNSGEWMKIVNYLLQQRDIEKHLCVGCGKGYIRKGDKTIDVNRSQTLAQVQAIVESIKKENGHDKIRNTSSDTIVGGQAGQSDQIQ